MTCALSRMKFPFLECRSGPALLYFVSKLPSDRFLSDMAFKFECFFPAIPGETEMMMLQGMTYKATLTLTEDVDPHDFEVEAWTSQCDKDNPDGD